METENFQNQVDQNQGAPNPPPVAPPAQTSMGLQQNVACLLAYLFSWLSGLIILLVEKQNKFVKFNAAQSLFLGIAVFVVWLVLGIIEGALLFVSFALFSLFSVLITLIWIAYLVLVIFLIYKSFKGDKVKLPLIGNIAENLAK
jgi:uncharacterized membrane protein